MKISPREGLLAWCSMVVVTLGLTYVIGESKVKELGDLKRTRVQWEGRTKAARRLLNQQPEVSRQMEEVRRQLPQYPAGRNVTAELLKMLEKTAQDHGLVLFRRDPEKERSAGDLFEVAIQCSWEADLEALVHFLYDLQTQGAILDIRQLTVSPGSGGPGRLKGTFTLDCAYTRLPAGS